MLANNASFQDIDINSKCATYCQRSQWFPGPDFGHHGVRQAAGGTGANGRVKVAPGATLTVAANVSVVILVDANLS